MNDYQFGKTALGSAKLVTASIARFWGEETYMLYNSSYFNLSRTGILLQTAPVARFIGNSLKKEQTNGISPANICLKSRWMTSKFSLDIWWSI